MFIKCYCGRNNKLYNKIVIVNTEHIVRIHLELNQNDEGNLISPLISNGKKYYLIEILDNNYYPYNQYVSEEQLQFLLNKGSIQ